jgi:hypothetical protein
MACHDYTSICVQLQDTMHPLKISPIIGLCSTTGPEYQALQSQWTSKTWRFKVMVRHPPPHTITGNCIDPRSCMWWQCWKYEGPMIMNIKHIYLWSQVVCFVVCRTEISQTNASCCTPGIFGKLFMSRAALTWFEMVWRLVFSPRLVLGNFTPSLQTFITEEV